MGYLGLEFISSVILSVVVHPKCHFPIPQTGEEDVTKTTYSRADNPMKIYTRQMLKIESLNTMHNRMHNPSFYMHSYSMHNSLIIQGKKTYIPTLIMFIISHKTVYKL